MTDMELRIKELLQEQGLRMADLADRLGMNQSNLVRSLSTNPKLSTLQDVANALNVQLHELFTPNLPSRPRGIVVVGGKAYDLVESRQTIQVPFYADYSKLRKDVRSFISNSINAKDGSTNAFCAYVGGYELMSLVYDRANARFILTLYYGGDMKSENLFYDRLEYAIWKNGKDKEPDWDVEQMMGEVMSDVENLVPFKYGDYTTPADREYEAEE